MVESDNDDPDLIPSTSRSQRGHGPVGYVALEQQQMLSGAWRQAQEEGDNLPDTPVPRQASRPLSEADRLYAEMLADPRTVRAYEIL